MRYFLSILLLFLFFPDIVLSQGEIDDQEKILFRNERTFGIQLNTNGYGLNFMYGKRINAFRKTIYSFDFSVIKHPKEYKQTLSYEGSRIAYGKINSFFALKGGIGFQKEIFSKRDKGAIAIRRYYNFGPSIGFVKPIYYEVSYDGNSTEDEQFDIDNYNYIQGKSSFFKGFDEISISPGAYAKVGLSFEHSKKDDIIRALEVGAMLEGYLFKIPIMLEEDGVKNNRIFLSAFFIYRFGKIIDKYK